MSPNAYRPEASAIAGKVHTFVCGGHQVMSIAAAESYIQKLTDAVEQAKKQEAEKA
ncbi:hypothetical protein SAMN02800692_2036 [Luteibacter sp. UNC138MFCol5.1]|uniref:hypothetical protein n=1 Tax=Luteibacter sp. UNC138MFCol5.1 TaxID=1502774 RepID=UPI0008CE6E3C|nr:hypothetical protein [Luteibacter sp. UNC138MFCol5.1]SEO77056.1 hypothetical protein SAMN02800692_2036 [Luteibacter sp. UNC138MFCol5.1]